MKSKRYSEEFKKEAIKQVIDRGYSVTDVAKRLGTTTHSVYAHWPVKCCLCSTDAYSESLKTIGKQPNKKSQK